MKRKATLQFALITLAVNCAATLHAGSVIQFSATSFTVAENVGRATFTLQRMADLDTPVSVDFLTTKGTATNRFKQFSRDRAG